MEKKYLEVEADYNDADYVSQRTLVSEKELKELLPILKIVKSNEGKVKKYKKMLDDSQDDLLHQYLPSAPDSLEIHTIESIKVLTVIKEEVLV